MNINLMYKFDGGKEMSSIVCIHRFKGNYILFKFENNASIKFMNIFLF